MSSSSATNRGSWLKSATVALFALPVLYVLSSGPMQLVRLPQPNVIVVQGILVPLVAPRVIETRWDCRIEKIYTPLSWLHENTILRSFFDRYWGLFSDFGCYRTHGGII